VVYGEVIKVENQLEKLDCFVQPDVQLSALKVIIITGKGIIHRKTPNKYNNSIKITFLSPKNRAGRSDAAERDGYCLPL
jgi:hypothetical protein